ncbi:MAG TPA: TetR/AcrR family transcriptional regulator, partial [Gammaproteobacteria bacterium]|nr:TetR/AcrR family transcriptional regulator [Gammaproteobacteria bacterium]
MAKHHRKTNPESEPLTRGFKKKARTRQTLVDAAIRIYAEKGVGALLLNELAERAGVSNGTVYNYFKTREEVLQAVGIELAN